MMIFKGQLRQQTLIHFFLLWIPDIIIAAVGSAYFKSGYVGFGFIFVGLQGLGIVYRILHSIVHWLAFLSFGRRMAQQHFYDYLIINRYPTPDEHELSAADYFVSVMENKELDPELRIQAAIEVGTFEAYSGALERQRLSKLLMAAEGAIKKYRVWLASTDLGLVYPNQENNVSSTAASPPIPSSSPSRKS
jgi:hypothetical protein